MMLLALWEYSHLQFCRVVLRSFEIGIFRAKVVPGYLFATLLLEHAEKIKEDR